MNNFLGGCNSQHQLPLLQQMKDGTYKMYTIRSDMMNKLFKQRPAELTSIDVGKYKTFFYEGDENISVFF